MKYTAEEVRARFEAWLIREHEYAPEDLIWQEKRNCYADYATHLAWNAYRAAHADMAGEVLELAEEVIEAINDGDAQSARNAAQAALDKFAHQETK